MNRDDERAIVQGDQDAAEEASEQDAQATAGGVDGPAATGDAGQAESAGEGPAQSKLESFLSQMLHQSQEVTGEAFRMMGGRLYTDSEAREVTARREERREERPLTPEEDQLLRERRAVLTVISDVRRQSSRGKLVEVGARWEEAGIVPAHMDPDTFTTFAVDRIEAARQGEPFQGSGLPVPPLANEPDGRDAPGEQGARDDQAAQGTPDEQGSRDDGQPTPADVGQAPDGETAATGAGDQDAPAADSAEPQAATSSQAAPSSPADDAALQEAVASLVPMPNPREAEFAVLSPEEQQVAGVERAGTREPKVLATVHDNLACRDLHFMDGVHGTYLFSDRFMSNNYAKWSLQALDGDDMETLAQNTREECRSYPRPLLARSLCNAPFSLSYEHVLETFRQMQKSGDYPDIKTCSASNGDVYFYSSDIMSARYAKSLAEFSSVERKMSV